MNLHAASLNKEADYLTDKGAHRLAAHIRAFWRAQGLFPNNFTTAQGHNAMNLHAASLNKEADYLTDKGAHRLAAHIRAFWRAQGLFPIVTVAKRITKASPSVEEHAIYVVESNMVGGRPL